MPAPRATSPKEAGMDFTTTTRGCIPWGTTTPYGVVEDTSYTAYLIGGQWVSFDKLHGKPPAATPLITFG